MTISALPTLNQTSSTFRDDADLFFSEDLPQFSIELENGRIEMNANRILAEQKAQVSLNQVTLAQNEVALSTNQAQAAALSAASVGATVWVSGTTYAIGVSRYSPIDSQVYRRLTAGAGTTDPSLDATNWVVVNSLPNQNIVLPVNNLPSVRPSFNMDFVNSQTVDPRITFTRASTATRTNNKGLIEVVPAGTPRIDYDSISLACKGLLIEEQRTNLLTYSEQFDNASWVKARSSITPNMIAAPDGTLTADKWVEDTATGVRNLNGASVSYVSGTAYTLSIYAKASERFLQMYFASGVFGTSNVTNSACFDLSAGTVVFGASLTATTAVITPVSSGWFRCSVTLTATVTTSAANSALFSLRNAYSVDVATGYTGDGTSGLYIWGAQLEAGAFPTSYQPSTETFTGRISTGTFYGSNGLIQTALAGAARMNYNPNNLTLAPKLLLEPASTNILTYSNALSTNWTENSNADTTRTNNASVSPSGATDATKLICATTSTAARTVLQINTGLTAGIAYCSSIYVKAAEYSGVQLWVYDVADSINVNIDLLTNLVTSGSGGVGSAISAGSVSVGNGWYRLWVAGIINPTSTTLTTRVYLKPTGGSSAVFAGTVGSGLFIWGAQLEAGVSPTSYIPTVATTVTRSADTSTSAANPRLADVASLTGANFSSWYQNNNGCFSIEATQNAPSIGQHVALGCGGSDLLFYTLNTATSLRSYDGTNIVQGGTVVAGVPFKAALSYSVEGGMVQCYNGLTLATSAFDGVFNAGLWFGTSSTGVLSLNGYIRSLSYYPEALTSAELQALSGL